MGGNGSAERVMKEVDKLPIHKFAIGKRKRIMNMSNKTYDTLKWIAMYLLPLLELYTLRLLVFGIFHVESRLSELSQQLIHSLE